MNLNRLLQLQVLRSSFFIPQASMAAQSRKDFEAIVTYNKLLKKPVVADKTYTDSELKRAKVFFDKVLEYRRRSEEGFKPSKLFLVWRIATVVGRPIWEKELIIKLGLHDHKVKYAIVKNTASNNKILWTIKHLIRIKPITFPDGFPTEEDFYNSFLKQTGELVVDKRLYVDSEEVEKDPEYKKNTLDPRTIREDLRLIWNCGYPKMF